MLMAQFKQCIHLNANVMMSLKNEGVYREREVGIPGMNQSLDLPGLVGGDKTEK